MHEPDPEKLALLSTLLWQSSRTFSCAGLGSYFQKRLVPSYEAEDQRPYVEGDDLRFVDWNASLRAQQIYIRLGRDVQSAPAWLLLDVSASMHFSSHTLTKYKTMCYLAHVLALSLAKNAVPVGYLVSLKDHPWVTPPTGEAERLWHIFEELVRKDSADFEAQMSIAKLLAKAGEVVQRTSLVVLFSDFLNPLDWQSWLRAACLSHDVMLIRLLDPIEERFTKSGVGVVSFRDVETGEQVSQDLDNPAFYNAYAQRAKKLTAAIDAAAATSGAGGVVVRTDMPLDEQVRVLAHYFSLREKMLRMQKYGFI